ncbi:ABC transporter permease subunit [Anaeromicropila herbilytica]|uniref:ABC transporter permease n=1 Tax=Anaeromicropila herbilytica TaxID=2785025 RepID=A0A7R7EQ76_9FIRM|nr:ABC transporter permease subunit [Anaeromicropila herbilytica]BCN32924.1 ABC transporter permease [Anaeromicropila herbilytica]
MKTQQKSLNVSMRNFFIFEFKKVFLSSKNLLIWAILVLILIGYALMNMNLDRHTTSNKEGNFRTDQYHSDTDVNELLVMYEDLDTIPDKVQEQLDFWRLNSRYISEQLVYSRWLGRDRFKDVLMSSIKQDKNMIYGIDKGFVTGGLTDNLKLQKQYLKNDISFKQILYKKNIHPLNSDYVMTGYHFLYRAVSDLLPFIFTIMVLLFSADCISNESESGSFKFLLIQPIFRAKVFLIKVFVSILHTFITVISTLLTVFLGTGLVNGFGEAAYPIAYDPITYHNFLSRVSENGALHYTGIRNYLLLILPIFLSYLVFLSVFSTFISSLVSNSLSSMSIVAASAILSYMFLRYLSHIAVFPASIPFAYGNISRILSGQNHITALFSIVYLLTLSLILIVSGCFIFKRRDIVC